VNRLLRFRLFGLLDREVRNPSRLATVGLLAAAFLTAILSGGLMLWLGSLLLSAIVTVVALPALGLAESIVIFGVVYLLSAFLKHNV
jgi:hypothetical protein